MPAERRFGEGAILESETQSFDLADERVWVVGDLHGNARWIQTLFPAMRRFDPTIRTVLQVGDYGFDHDGRGTHAVDFWARKAGIERVLVTLGNHEAWDRIAPAQARAPGRAIRVSEVVWLLPRPFRMTIADRKVLSLGGASSVDKAIRTPGKDWFEEELITQAMETRAILGGRADLLLTHEAPVNAAPEVRAIIASNPDGYPPDALAISAAQRQRVQRVSNAVRPVLHFHGHMHTYGTAELGDGRRVVSLDRDTRVGNAGVLDLVTLTFEPLRGDHRGR
ncbi:metallophosphoesterase [Microbacterium sp. NPDC089321]|uniref:metallophosphoesterase family protein n=1 Tax=Microbacterium sp. NPDC089321 TaxID=3155183 RepID=UPI0034172FC2